LEGSLAVLPFSAVLRWIWERNKDWHDFFIEESFPMIWTYDYAIPWGLCYRMSPVKLTAIPQQAVVRDMEFWAAYKNRLLGDPLFATDQDARNSFSRLRNTTGNIYRHRGMTAEAETAYREAIELNPADGGAISSLMGLLWDREEFEEPLTLIQAAIGLDRNNQALRGLLKFAGSRRELQERIARLTAILGQQPANRNALIELVMLHAGVGNLVKANRILSEGFQRFPNDADFLRFAAAHDVINGQPLNSLAPAIRLTQIEPLNPANQFILAHAWYSHTNMPEFYKAMGAAIDAGGTQLREMFAKDDYFAPLRSEPEFRQLMERCADARSPGNPPAGR
jgi:tetratricopeptide (TPR) repeat protein